MAIPIMIGVTGHRDLRPQDLPRLRAAVDAELAALKARRPGSPLLMLNALAAGADLLCAEAAAAAGIPLVCPLPLAPEEYRRDFSGGDTARFDAQLAAARRFFVVPGPEDASRDDCYRRAGFYIAEHCQILLALWDGQPPKPGGCGTAETAAHFLDGGDLPPRTAALIHIVTPRLSGAVPEAPLQTAVRQCGPVPAADTLAVIDHLNPALGDAPEPEAVADAADAAAVAAQKRHFRSILALALLCALLVSAFLAYDELESNLFLPLYAAALLAAWLILKTARKRMFHPDFLRYRILAETLRTQAYLCHAGAGDLDAWDFYAWSQKTDLLWLREALRALSVFRQPEAAASPAAWFAAQHGYHRRAAARKERQHRRNSRLCAWMTAASVALFAAVFLLEFLAPGAMERAVPVPGALRALLLMHNGDLIVRGLFKVALGVVSAVTLFLSSYYGRLSLDRQIEDHRKMAALYAAALQQPEPGPELAAAVAREEILENGSWLSYSKENTPGIDL